ncbi:phospholipase effector Tle1 domain-containing protein [Yoonia sp.]|uniref:phospholipase effector Tle1 domain-containing protein n=1 Tax=Yoonia sp. TaxID=2212373 RepID=UPI00358F2306
MKNYDKLLDSDVRHARHALAIDEQRKNFPRVKWARPAEAEKTIGRQPDWLKQVWFAGCHSDVGGSYPEPESRLSDIALQWMVDEFRECVPDVQINDDMLHIMPDPKGMQHEETYMFAFGPFKRRWPVKPREVVSFFELHPSVKERLDAELVSHVGEMRPYRPKGLKDHPKAKGYFDE